MVLDRLVVDLTRILPGLQAKIGVMRANAAQSLPFCDCHSFTSLESRTLPILSNADIAEPVFLSALEFIPRSMHPTAEDRKTAHDNVMKLQEDFLSKVAERVRRYTETIRSECLASLREWNKYE